MSDQSLLYFICTAVFVFCSAWASAVEAAFFSLNTDVVDRFRSSNDKRERRIAELLSSPRLLLYVLTACKYTMLLAAAVLSISSFVHRNGVDDLQQNAVGTTVLILTMTFAIAGVILAKIHGTNYHLPIAKRNGKLCSGLVKVLRPLVKPLLKSSVVVQRKLDAKTEQKSVEALTQALQLATADNEPVEGEKEILEGIVNFGTLTVKQVMKSKAEISYTEISLTFHQLMDFVKKSGYSRIPVCRGSLEHIEGVLYIKDLLPFLEEGAGFAWQKLLRPGYMVQDVKKIDFLLKDFQEKRVHMALVVNPLGATVGLITLEDIIEEIIGDFDDEFDEPGARFQKLSEHIYLFDGKTSLHEFCKILHIEPEIFQPVKGINGSLNGALLAVNEKLPSIGDTIVIEPFTFIVESVSHKRIKKVRVEIHAHDEK